ncbi:MAG: nuclear transport factor 2 family protein [Solirubrobacterales bacterium]|nr:nuclear transport factor 2 family protein [Solirubrobacterales bacterium]
MYHAIVKRIAPRNFERVNDHDYEALLKNCTPDVHHRFGGHHALGGERHDKEALRRWFGSVGWGDSQAHGAGRLGQSLPNDTTVIIRWNATQTLPDGSPYANHGVHIVQMRCGRIIAIDANEHSQVVAESMPVFAAAGVEDALAEPITS